MGRRADAAAAEEVAEDVGEGDEVGTSEADPAAGVDPLLEPNNRTAVGAEAGAE